MTAKIVVVCDICKSEIKEAYKGVIIQHRNTNLTDLGPNNIYDMCNSCYKKLVLIHFDNDNHNPEIGGHLINDD